MAAAIAIAAAPGGVTGFQNQSAGAALTPRERDVLVLVAEGRTDQEVADRLFLSRRTVNAHVARILAKLDARTRRDAAIRGRELGLLPPGDAPFQYTTP